MIGLMPIRRTQPLVGRDDELGRARRALGLADADPSGGLLLLAGDAGIGKTALVGAVLEGVRATQRALVLTGHCVGEAGADLPFLPFVEMFARLDGSDTEMVEELLRVHPHLVRLLPRRAEDATAPGPGGEHERGRLLEAVHGALEWLARDRPVLVVVEDLHWADESSRDLLTLLFTRGFTGPVSVLATYRSDDLHRRHPLRSSLSLWSRLTGLSRIDLEPLEDHEVADLVRALADLPQARVDEVVERAEGNAFFAEELASAAAQGVTTELADLSRLLLARVEPLDEETQEIVRVAAVVGRRVPQALLERVVGSPPHDLERLLRHAVEHHVLEPLGADGYMFRHALLAEAVYDDLLPSQRLRIHRACSRALRDDPSVGTPADLARHALAAGEHEVAVGACLDAGRTALRVGGVAEALAHFERGLGLAPAEDARARDLLLGAVDAALAGGRTNRALGHLRDRLDRRLDRGPERAELLGRLSSVLRLTEDRTDRDALTSEAVSLLEDASERQRAEVLVRRAEYLADAGRRDEAATAVHGVMEAAAALGGGVHAELMSVVARLSVHDGDPAESLRRLADLVARSESVPDLPMIRAMHTIGSVHYRQENLRAALAAYRACVERARAAGLPWAPYATDARAMAVTVAYELGEWDLALGLADTEGEHAPEFAAAALDSAASYVHAGRGSDLAVEMYPRIRRLWPRDGMLVVQSGSATLDALGYAGDVDRAWEVHHEVVGFIRELWGMPDVAAEVRLAALLLGRTADHVSRLPADRLGRLVARAEEVAGRAAGIFASGSGRPAPDTEGRAWSARAEAEHLRLRWRAGLDVDEASLRGTWEEAARLFADRAHPYEAARSQAELAGVLAAGGQRDRADELGRAARDTARRLGARPLLARLRLLDPIDRPADGAPALTARESEVLALIAEGRSNGQIGTALFISTKTVSVHVSNILAKLGARSRGEAAALARARGLLP